jgi:subtilisin family serine protease
MLYKFKRYSLLFTLLTTAFIASPIKAETFTYDVAPANAPVKFTFSLSTAIPFIAANLPHQDKFIGDGTYVVIIDTGIQKDHPFFQQRVALEACFAPKCPNGLNQQIGSGAANPVHWHGTHVAGIAAGYNSSYNGVAPGAKIIAINVFDSTGAAYDSDIIKALNWVNSISSQYNITSINMSLGGSTPYKTTCDDYIPAMTKAIEDLRANSIATVISSGNSYAHGMSAPACISSAVSVAAMYTNSTAITNFSNINKHTTIAAPGHSILSSTTSSKYTTASGTSMAAPFVTGAFAVYRSKFGKQSVDKVVSDFTSTTKRAVDSYTSISLPYLHFGHLFSSSNPTPITTTTTTTTIPSTTTTTIPTLPVIPPTTTTIPVTTSTTSTTTTIPSPSTPPSYGQVFAPILHELDASWKTFIKAYYRDPHKGYASISHYTIVCNDSSMYTYTVPKTSRYGWNSYNIRVSPSLISHCRMNTHGHNGSIVSTRNMFTSPRNRSLSLSFNNFTDSPSTKSKLITNKNTPKKNNKKKSK